MGATFLRTYTALDTIPKVQAKSQGRKQRPTAIVVRPSFTPSRAGSALALAQCWLRYDNFWEAGHYAVDESQRFECVPVNRVAGVKDGVRGAVRIAVSAEPFSRTQFWAIDEHLPVLRNLAELIALLCTSYKIRPHRLTTEAYNTWSLYPFRFNGGIYIEETSGFPESWFFDEIEQNIYDRSL